MIRLFSTKSLQSFRAAFQLVHLQCVLVHGVIPPQGQGLALPFVEPCDIPVRQLSSLLRSLWMAAQSAGALAPPPFFVSSANSAPLSKSLMKMLNGVGSSINPWSTLVVTVLQLNCVPLSMAAQFSTDFTVHLPSSPICLRDFMGERSKRPTEVDVNSIRCSPFTHQGSHLIVEGCQVGQVRFPFHTNMLTSPNHHAFFIFGNGFQNYLLHHLPKDQGEAGSLSCDWHVVLWILFLALPEYKNDIIFLPVLIERGKSSGTFLRDLKQFLSI